MLLLSLLCKAWDRVVTPKKLVTTGAYAHMQHPIYTSYMVSSRINVHIRTPTQDCHALGCGVLVPSVTWIFSFDTIWLLCRNRAVTLLVFGADVKGPLKLL